jgi:hypothetical protein
MVVEWGLAVREMLIYAAGFLASVGVGVGVDVGFGGLINLPSMSMKNSARREAGCSNNWMRLIVAYLKLTKHKLIIAD